MVDRRGASPRQRITSNTVNRLAPTAAAACDQPRIVAFSADAAASDQALFLVAGMDDYVSKPVKLATIESVLRQAAAHRLTRLGVMAEVAG